jgi:hypothetical protein
MMGEKAMNRLAAACIMTLLPAVAAAQETRTPRLEFAAHVSGQTGRQNSATWSPRITWNVTPLSAIEATADFSPTNNDPNWGRRSARGYSLHLRQSLLTRSRWQVFGVLGVGSSETHTTFARHIVTVGDYSWDIPEQTIEETSVAVHVGPAAQVQVAPWLSLRADVRLTLSENNSGLRGMIGAVVPVGTLPPNPKFTQRDRLSNGIRNGAVTGVVSGGVLYAWGALALCDTDDCGTFALSAITFGTVSGAVVGGLIGAMVDSLIGK